MRKLKTLLRLPLKDKVLAVEVIFYLLFSRAAVELAPRRWLNLLYGEMTVETPERLNDDQEAEAAHIARMIAIVRRNLPWHSTCLMDAVAGKLLLTRRRIPSTLYVGFMRDTYAPNPTLNGHAWLRSGRWCVTGLPIHPSFKVMNFYGTNPS